MSLTLALTIASFLKTREDIEKARRKLEIYNANHLLSTDAYAAVDKMLKELEEELENE